MMICVTAVIRRRCMPGSRHVISPVPRNVLFVDTETSMGRLQPHRHYHHRHRQQQQPSVHARPSLAGVVVNTAENVRRCRRTKQAVPGTSGECACIQHWRPDGATHVTVSHPFSISDRIAFGRAPTGRIRRSYSGSAKSGLTWWLSRIIARGDSSASSMRTPLNDDDQTERLSRWRGRRNWSSGMRRACFGGKHWARLLTC